MSFTPAVEQLITIPQGEHQFRRPSHWCDGIALAATTATAYNVTTARTNAGVAAGTPLFAIISVDTVTYMSIAGTAGLPTTNTDGAGPMNISANVPLKIYLDASITSLSFYAASTTKVTIELFRT